MKLKGNHKCSCDKSQCMNECDSNSKRMMNTIHRKELHMIMFTLKEALIKSYLLEDFEKVKDLKGKLQIIQQKLHD